MRMYEELGEAVANGEIDTDEYQLSLQQQCSKYNLSLLVLNANSEVVADSGGGSEFLKQQLLQHLFALSGEKYEITAIIILSHAFQTVGRKWNI